MAKRSVVAMFLGIVVISLPMGGALGLTVPSDGILEKATGHRFPDPVTLQGKAFPSVTGGPLNNYRLYACQQGRFEPIRFQIDEMTEEGDYIFPFGSRSNKDQSNNILDEQDLVMFMAHDAGDRVSETFWPKNAGKGIEIEVIDPVDQTRSWGYLFFFERAPPPRCPLPDYTNYDYDTNTLWSEYWRAQHIIRDDGKRMNVYKEFSILPKGGGSGENFVDRLKVRSTIGLFFGKITIKTNEEKLESYAIDAWLQGPVRTVRRLEHIVKGPFGMTLVRIHSDVYYYETMFTVPIQFNFPFKIERVVTSLFLRIGTEYSPVVKGSTFYNSNNLQGVHINGKMDETEKNFNPAPDSWRVIVGEWGSFMSRRVLTPEAQKYLKIVQGITDDETVAIPPETFPGSIGWTWQDWRIGQLPGGRYTFYLEFYTPPNYKLSDEVPYLNYMDHPVKVKIAGQIHDNQARLFATPGDDF